MGGLLLMASLSLASSGVGVGLLPLPPLVAEVVIVLLSASWSFAYQARACCVLCSGHAVGMLCTMQCAMRGYAVHMHTHAGGARRRLLRYHRLPG